MSLPKSPFFLIIPIAAVLFFWILSSSSRSSDLPKGETGGKLRVAASFYPLAYFASRIGGDTADVFVVTPPGVEPHDYEPTPADIIKIEKSDLLILNGQLEPWAGSATENLRGGETRVLVAGDGMIRGTDPHTWLSPKLAALEAGKIRRELAAIDPKNAGEYEQNSVALSQELSQLDSEFRQGLANCNKREFLTSHAAFSYLAQEYGLQQVPVAGISPDEEPSAKEMAELARYAKEKEIKFIFLEKLASPRLAQTLALEADAQTLVLDPLEGLSKEDENSGKNYFTIMRENLAALEKALECTR